MPFTLFLLFHEFHLLLRQGNSVICESREEPCGHYAEQNKSVRERRYSMIPFI